MRFYALLERAGYPITEGPIRFPTGTRAIFARDPDRNVVEFDKFLTPEARARAEQAGRAQGRQTKSDRTLSLLAKAQPSA